MAITVMGDFVAYNVYRADCTRTGVGLKAHPDAYGGSGSSYYTEADDKELYLEFGELQLTQQGLPDGVALDGMGVEVRVHFGGVQEFTDYTSKAGWSAANFSLGVCAERVPADVRISYNTLPERRYSFAENPENSHFFRYNTPDYRGEESYYTDSAISRVLLYSSMGQDMRPGTQVCSPLEVYEAIKSAALVVKRTFDLGGAMVYTTATNAPYVEVIIGMMKPRVNNLVGSGYLSPYIAQELTWRYAGMGDYTMIADGTKGLNRFVLGGYCPQEKAELEITLDSSGTVQTHEIAGNVFGFVVPQGIMDSGKFRWRARVCSEQGVWSDYSEQLTVTTVDSISTASVVAPKNTYVNVDDAVFFDWTHIIATGTPQSKYEIQGLNNGGWITLQEESTSDTSAVVPVDTFSSSFTAWRVRTANNDGVYGEYSEPAQVIFVVAPQVTGVTITGNVRPTVAWQSADQQGYEIMIDDVTMGVQYGTEKSLMWNDLLSDGQHVVQVRVINQFGLFSKWAEVTHEVVNVPQEAAPVLNAGVVGDADVRLMWADDGAAETLVYRDGELIGCAQSAGVYVDHTACDKHVYRVRVVAADSNYTDSNDVTVVVPLRETMLAAAEEWNWIELAYSATAEPPVRTAELMPLYALNFYSGREKPVPEMSRHKSATYGVTYAVTEQQAVLVRDMIGKIVVHKRKGETIRGLLQSVSEERAWWGVNMTLQIVEVDEG